MEGEPLDHRLPLRVDDDLLPSPAGHRDISVSPRLYHDPAPEDVHVRVSVQAATPPHAAVCLFHPDATLHGPRFTGPLRVPTIWESPENIREEPPVPQPQLDAVRAALHAAIAAHDRAGAVRAVTRAVRESRIALDDVYPRLLVPLLVAVGTAWEAGEERVWEEHLTSSIVRTVIESLAVDVADAAASVPPNGRTALLACPAGELHELGLRMLADRLALRGWTVHFLGADTPAAEVVASAQALGADLVALSAATHYNLVLLRSFVDEVKSGLPGVQVGVGGPALSCNHQLAAEDLLLTHELGIDDDPAGVCDLPDTGA